MLVALLGLWCMLVLGAVRGWIAARSQMGRRATRARRVRPVERSAANDDEDGAGFALVA